MGKVLKPLAAVAAIAVAFVPGVGTAISGAVLSSLGTSFAAVGVMSTVMGGIAALGVMSALGIATKALGLGPSPPKASPASTDRLRASIDPRAFRKIWFGETAGSTDVRYQEFHAPDQDYLDSVIFCASHAVQSIDEIWFDEKMAWSAASGVASEFSGYLWVWPINEGTTSNGLNLGDSGSWTAADSRAVGLAYVAIRYKLSGNTKKSESPFSSNVTSRITIRGKGAKIYDPRLDSTVAGGSGSHRANDQSTWAWVSDDVGRNPALQLLWYLIGWRIENPTTSELILAVGQGLPIERIDMESFAAAANICDEDVTLAAGGTEPRYRADGVFSEGDDPQVVFQNLLASMNGVLRDAGGKISLDILVNDLGAPVVALSESDIIGEVAWLPTTPLDQSFNVVRGKYIDASDEGLYQPVDYPDVILASPDGIERPAVFDFMMVQSASQAQRLAKTFLQRAQYTGTIAGDFLASAWQCTVGSVVTLTFPALGDDFDGKLFRVIEHTIRTDGTCAMVLREEHENIYAWDADEAPAVVVAAPITYDPINDPIVQQLATIETGATVGADWTSTLDNRPTELTDGRVSTALASTGEVNSSKVLTDSIEDNGVTVPWYYEASNTISFSSGPTKNETHTVTIEKYVDESWLDILATFPFGASDAIDCNVYLEVQSLDGATTYAARVHPENLDANGTTIDSKTFHAVFFGIDAGDYNVKAYVQRTTSNTLSVSGVRHMKVGEFKR